MRLVSVRTYQSYPLGVAPLPVPPGAPGCASCSVTCEASSAVSLEGFHSPGHKLFYVFSLKGRPGWDSRHRNRLHVPRVPAAGAQGSSTSWAAGADSRAHTEHASGQAALPVCAVPSQANPRNFPLRRLQRQV